MTIETSRAAGNRRVFIVHRDDNMRAVLEMILHDGCEAHEITCLEGGAKQRVNLVLLDATIVREEGVALFKKLAEERPGARFLLVTKAGDDAFTQACLRAGADGILAAPFQLEVRAHGG
ncbi:MAG: response regulator [Isosphaeraceae bacterium]|nr:response regulator [Isosphaeraceae bacterium]